jgi:hypothetical protein
MIYKIFFVLAILFFASCEEEQALVLPKPENVSGKIEVFNSCGILGAASEAKEILRDYGFDVLSAQTDPNWSNYEETIIAIRNPHWEGDGALKIVLDTKNFITLQDTISGIIDATIFLGHDYRKVFKMK